MKTKSSILYNVAKINLDPLCSQITDFKRVGLTQERNRRAFDH